MKHVWLLKITNCDSDCVTRAITAGEDFDSAVLAANAYMAKAYPNTLSKTFPGPWYPDYAIVGLTRGTELSDDDEDLDGRLARASSETVEVPRNE